MNQTRDIALLNLSEQVHLYHLKIYDYLYSYQKHETILHANFIYCFYNNHPLKKIERNL